jgi:putative membrane-bound dehydrogenase-like protein
MILSRVTSFFAVAFVLLCAPISTAGDLDVLFLGDSGHHQPRPRFEQLQPVLADRGIRLVYTEAMSDLNAENLALYDALLLYANIDEIAPNQETALLDYVTGGGGFVPLHCATYCFRNSDRLVALMGAQFQRHGTGVFRTTIEQQAHPIMEGFGGFESWDETYVHHLHNEKDRTVLSYRVDDQGREPWTWIRTQGKGRVFYTAWGHDQRTWGNPGFQNLVERGIRWAAGDDVSQVPAFVADMPFPVPQMTQLRKDVEPFEFIDVGNKIPNYTPGEKWGVQGRALSKMQSPLPASESIKHVVTPEGFHVELFASEPDIGGKPIAMAWDHRGRLWVAETYDYPNELQPIGKGRDRIRILEDTDGDWKADKFTVFADKLSIPTSITFHRGGAIVQDGTRTLYLKDNDGDDVADQREVIFTGWSQGDTHGGVSNFQYGLDNWIWGMQGYNDSAPEIDGQPQQSFRQGFFRFRPDGSEVEFIRSTNNNTWGLGISEEGLIFGSTANRNPSVYMPIANRYYERVRGWATSLRLDSIADTYLFDPITENIRQVDHHGGYTAAAGHALYTARQYPREYWNRAAFVNGPTGHLVGTFVLKANGSDFGSTSPFNLFASDDEWSAPIMSEVGPDGNVWVIDWYNYIVQHNPTPQGFQTGKGNAYLTDLRDKKHGRIYRVIYDAAGTSRPFSLADATTDGLIDALKHPTMLWRKHAQRLLVERADLGAVDRLIQLTQDRSTDEIGLNVGANHALWTLEGLGQLDGSNPRATAAVVAALNHPSPGVRRNALQVLPLTPESTESIVVAGITNDDDAQVRLAAMLALADLPPSTDAGVAIFNAVSRRDLDSDRWIQDACVSAAANNAQGFLTALASSSEKPSSRTLETIKIVAAHYGRTGPVDSLGSVVSHLTDADPAVADAILVGLASGWPADRTPQLSDPLESDLKKLMDVLPASSGGLLVKLARGWGSKQFERYAREVSESLLSDIDDDKLTLEARTRAARELVQFRSQDEDVVSDLLDRITPQTESTLAAGIVRAVAESESPTAGQALIACFANLTPQTRIAGVAVLLSRPESTQALLKAIDDGDVLLSELSLDQKQALMAHPSESIRKQARRLLGRGGALPNADRQAVMQSMMPATTQEGDVANGKVVFKKNCANCHIHGGEGQRVGPDLTGMAVHPKAELLTHILDPSRDVEGNYRVYSVLSIDGVVINGLLASESKTAIEMYDAEGKKKSILREDIDLLRASAKSLMPEGFEKQIPATDMADLLEFLTARGQFVPVDMAKVATIASDRGMFVDKQADVERLIFSDWQPKTFNKVTFNLTDPNGGRVPNAIVLHSPNTAITQQMPKSVTIPCNGPARAIHMLSGVSGWGFPFGGEKTVSMIVRIHYADGEREDHELRNGEHFADYIRRVDVPQSEFAFPLRGQQIRYLAVYPMRKETIKEVELVKGDDLTAPVVMAVTLESPQPATP